MSEHVPHRVIDSEETDVPCKSGWETLEKTLGFAAMQAVTQGGAYSMTSTKTRLEQTPPWLESVAAEFIFAAFERSDGVVISDGKDMEERANSDLAGAGRK